MSPLLLDTNAAIWLSRDELTAFASERLDEAARTGVATYVSPITAWEVGQLVSRNRLSLGTTPQRYLQRYRLSKALQLLQDTDAKIYDIARRT